MGVQGSSDTLTIVIPTYEERDNVRPLLHGLAEVRDRWGGRLDILVVDDGSSDGTPAEALVAADELGLRLRVVERAGPRSLGRAIVEGMTLAHGGLVGVMDADLSHPPKTLTAMLEALDGADGVIASRYGPGGTIASWPWTRRVVSLGATALARGLCRTPSTDPVSGFFLFRREAFAGLRLSGLGNKPLVEVLAQRDLVVHEVPYAFRDRQRGRSKLRLAGIVDFARLILRLSHRASRAEPIPGVPSGRASLARRP